MKVLFINRCFGADRQATGQILAQLCETLQEAHQSKIDTIEVIAGGESTIAENSYGHHLRVIRLPFSQFSKSSRFGRLFCLVWFSCISIVASLFRRRPDVIVTMTDPFFLPLVGEVLKTWHRCRRIAYLQDIYPDIAIVVGEVRESWLTKLIRKILFSAIKRADKVIVLSHDMQRTCIEYGVSPAKLEVIANWSDTNRITPLRNGNAFRNSLGLRNEFTVMYSGNMGRAHILEPLLSAAQALSGDASKVFVFVGEGAQKRTLQQKAQSLHLTNVRFFPYQPSEDLAESLSAADLHVVSMLPGADRCLMPSKIYGIMASGTPVLAICPKTSELAHMISELELGIVCDPTEGDHGLLVERIVYAVHFMSSNKDFHQRAAEQSRKYAVEQYDRQVQADKFSVMLEKLVLSA